MADEHDAQEAEEAQAEEAVATAPAPETKATLTPEQINKLLKADLSNLVRKVSSGRTLSTNERQLLLGMGAGGSPTSSSKVGESSNPFAVPEAAPPKWVKNQTALADLLGVTRRTIHRWRRVEGSPKPRSNGEWPVDAWRKWLVSHGVLAPGDPDVDALKAETIALQNKKLAVQVAVLSDEYVAVSDVVKWTGDMIMRAKKVFLAIPAAYSPQVIGLSAVDAEVRLREAITEGLIQMSADPCGLMNNRTARRNGSEKNGVDLPGLPHGRHAPRAKRRRKKDS